jgi:hypothetical protein
LKSLKKNKRKNITEISLFLFCQDAGEWLLKVFVKRVGGDELLQCFHWEVAESSLKGAWS